MLNTKVQASEPSGAKAEDFFSYFPMYFYGAPWHTVILDPRAMDKQAWYRM